MKAKQNILDILYQHVEQHFSCTTTEEPFGRRYTVGPQFGSGNFHRIKMDEGIELSKFQMDYSRLGFTNRRRKDSILEVGYCLSGSGRILAYPQAKEYLLQQGDCFFYTTLNEVEHFRFSYQQCKTISIHMDVNAMQGCLNAQCASALLAAWQKRIQTVFRNDVLVIQKGSVAMKRIAAEIDATTTLTVMDYMKLKCKTLEFLDVFFREEANRAAALQPAKLAAAAQELIAASLSEDLSVSALAKALETSQYKLQTAFRYSLGMTVYEYIKQARLARAKQLLCQTDLSVLAIVQEVGYENPGKFARLFQAYFGLTPLHYRKLHSK